MNWKTIPSEVNITPIFEKDLRRLRRRFPSVTGEVRDLIISLESDERPGDKISGVGYDVHKVRLRNRSASRGKSGRFRVIYYLQVEDQVVLLTIYSKTDQDDISIAAIQQILHELVDADVSNDDEDS